MMTDPMKKRLTMFTLMLFCLAAASAQNLKLLTVEEAVGIAMKNNFNLMVAQNNADLPVSTIPPAMQACSLQWV